MTLMEFFESLGGRLGILEKATQSSPRSAVKIQTRKVTLSELTAEIRAEEVRTLADAPAELSVPFEKIFETAGIAPAQHGWTIERLRQLLLTDAFKNLEREAAQKRILDVLNTEGVAVEDVIKDAVARDTALDAFEAFARRKAEDRMTTRERRAAELESKIDELKNERDLLKSQAKSDQEKWSDWRKRKRAQERDLAWTVGYLIDRPVITTDDGD